MTLTQSRNTFIGTTALLCTFGMIMVYSSSYMYAIEVFGSSVYFVKKQSIAMLIGALSALVLSKTKIQFWFKASPYLLALSYILVALTLSPMFGVGLNGSHRWIKVLGMKIQPAEILKITLLLASARYFDQYPDMSRRDRILFAVMGLAPLSLLVLQPDFGAFSICLLICLFLCFVSDFPRKHFYSLMGLGITVAAGVLVAAPYRIRRILVFLDPWRDPQNMGFQIIQSYLAFANGGVLGVGLGNSNEKLFYLPEAYNDFIFSVIGEELGLIGVSFVIATFLVLLYAGLSASLKASSRFGQMVAAGLIFTVGIQAFLNMGVVLGLLPTKGLNLPFISFGGSSMVSNMVALGLFLSATRTTEKA